MITNKAEIIANLRSGIKIASDMTGLEKQRDEHKADMVLLADVVENLIAENARIAQDQTEYNKKYNLAMERYEAAKIRYEDAEQQLAEAHKRVRTMETFIQNVQELGVITEFDENLWGMIVDSVTVYSKDDIRVKFKN